MKSILVDALRQANGEDTDKALSDSGSFDASNQEFEATANDPLADGELELMSTTNALIVREEAAADPASSPEHDVTDGGEAFVELEFDDGPVEDEHAVTVVGLTPLPVSKNRIPLLARLSPILCVAIAMAVSGMWLLLQHAGVSGGTVGNTMAQSSTAASVPAVVDDEATRFPFLQDGKPLAAEDSTP